MTYFEFTSINRVPKRRAVLPRSQFGVRKLDAVFVRPRPVARYALPRTLTSLISGTARHVMKATAISMLALIVILPFFQAFEAHIINVTAEIAQIDPPVLTIPGDIGWDEPVGGTGLIDPEDIIMSDADPDATHIYYTFGAGLDPDAVADPVCGDVNGGDKTAPQHLEISEDTVIKAIACDGTDGSAHKSVINTKIYDYNQVCPPTPVDFPTDLALLAAGPGNSSSGDIFISSNVTVNGDVRSNDDINANGSGTNRFINGDATAGDNVEVANFTISGVVATGTATTVLPDINIPLWEDLADDGGTVNGSLIFPNNTVGIDLGPSKITGNLTFGSGNSATISGPLYVQGNLTIGANTTITQNAGFGDQFATIIVDGTIDINSNVAFNGSGTIGTLLLVSTHAPVAGDDAAIETNSNNSDLGDVVLYASAGDVHINQNRELLAIFATLGTSSSNPAIDLDSNVIVTWRDLPDEIGCGPEFTPIEQVLINEFVPNPTGSDTGAAGGALDGEWVELYNGSTVSQDVGDWVLYDENNANELFITLANISASSTIIYPGEFLVVYREGDADFALNNDDDTVRLYNDEIGDGGVLIDSRTYDYGGNAPDNKSFTRMPDGTANWIDPEPTPGEPNDEFLDLDITPSEPIVFESEPSEEEEQIIDNLEFITDNSDATASSTTPTLEGDGQIIVAEEGDLSQPSADLPTPVFDSEVAQTRGGEEGEEEASADVTDEDATLPDDQEVLLPDDPNGQPDGDVPQDDSAGNPEPEPTVSDGTE